MTAAIDLEMIDMVELERGRMAEKMGLLTEEQVIKLAKAAPSTVEDWRKRGRGPAHIRFGNAFFYDIQDVSEFLRAQKRDHGRDAITRSI